MIIGGGKPTQEILSMVEPYSKIILRPNGSTSDASGWFLSVGLNKFPALAIEGSLNQPLGESSKPVLQTNRRVLSFDYLSFQLDKPLLENVSHE